MNGRHTETHTLDYGIGVKGVDVYLLTPSVLLPGGFTDTGLVVLDTDTIFVLNSYVYLNSGD